MKILAISGHAQNGKDTVAGLLRDILKADGNRVLVTHYADLLKYMCRTFFDWDGNKDEKGRHILQLISKGFDVTHIKVIRSNFESSLTEEQKKHPSETALDNVEPDFYIYNEGSIEELKVKINEWIKENLYNCENCINASRYFRIRQDGNIEANWANINSKKHNIEVKQNEDFT